MSKMPWQMRSSRPSPTCDLPADDRYNPAAMVEKADEIRAARARLDRVLAALEPITRKAWEMHYLQGESFAAISQQLDVPIGTLASRFHRMKEQARIG